MSGFANGRSPFLVVTLPAARAEDPWSFVRDAQRAGARLVEVRLDLTPGLEPFDAELPLVFAPRGAPLPQGLRPSLDAVDLDLELDAEGEAPHDAILVRSFHDHEGTPDEQRLLDVGRELRALGCTVVKLAVTPTRYEHLERLNRVRDALARDGATIVHAMGPLAELERTLSPWQNAWTYARLDAAASAPGQIDLARYARIVGPTAPALFGVYGSADAVAASGGPKLHESWFDDAGLRAAYLRFPLCDLTSDFDALARLGVRALSVTTPAKEAAFEVANGGEESLLQTRSANTLFRSGDGWRALQSDTMGLTRGYPQLRGCASVAVVGSGGVVPAVLLAARELQWRELTVFGRNADRLQQLAHSFDVQTAPLDQLGEHAPDLVVWCLPVDLPELPLPKGPGAALDLRYGRETDFLCRMRDAGREVYDGLPMFEGQARGQFEVFELQLR